MHNKKEPVADMRFIKKRTLATGSFDTRRMVAPGPSDTHGSHAVSVLNNFLVE
jgi:hypothetical protein